jgi:hypothetical protein
MRTGGIGEGPFSYTWSFPVCPHRVTIDLSIVEALQVEVAAGAEPRHGILFGQTGPGITHIAEWLSLRTLDRESLEAALRSDTRQAVGYYVIRDGSAFILSPAEVAIVQELFNKQGSVVLLVERRRKGPAEASFFFWRNEVFVHNLPLPFPFHAGILSGETPGLADVPKIAAGRARLLTRAQRRVGRLALYGLTAMAAGGLLAAYFRDLRAAAPKVVAAIQPGARTEVPSWIPTEPQRDLELTWDPTAQPVSTATAGLLKIEDAGQMRQMSLDLGELMMGTVVYAPASDRIRVELTTLQRDGRMAVAAVTPKIAGTTTPPVPETIAPLKRQLLAEAPKLEAPAKKLETPPAAEGRRPPLKRFTWTNADRVAPVSREMPDAPHAAPPVINPAVLTAALPPSALGVPTAPPPPPKAAPAPAPARPVARAGRVIWTGTLQRRGIVEVDGRSVSVGSLNGALPGAPVNLTIVPAEFGENGLVVYTTDAARHNRVEPASAGNGWNQVTYVWDPERVRQLSVLEAPNPNNGYNRIALRNDARRCSMILIDWSLR